MENETRNVLLTVRDLKQYFPVKKTKLMDRESHSLVR